MQLPRPAFSAMELILVIAIIALVFAATIPFAYRFRNQQLRETLQTDLIQVLRQAQLRALQSEAGSDWGVHLSSGSFVLYRGSSYNTREPSFDITYNIHESVTWTGLSEITFHRGRGTPFTGGTLQFSDQASSGTIIVNTVGGIFFKN